MIPDPRTFYFVNLMLQLLSTHPHLNLYQLPYQMDLPYVPPPVATFTSQISLHLFQRTFFPILFYTLLSSVSVSCAMLDVSPPLTRHLSFLHTTICWFLMGQNLPPINYGQCSYQIPAPMTIRVKYNPTLPTSALTQRSFPSFMHLSAVLCTLHLFMPSAPAIFPHGRDSVLQLLTPIRQRPP